MSSMLSRRYGLGKAFSEEWKRQWGSDLADLLATPDGTVDQLWGDFALSTNLRGRDMAIDLSRRVTKGMPSLFGLRALDLGCGVGGTAVAMAELGAETVGMDLDPARVKLATANALDHEVAVGFEAADALDPATRERLGAFDLIVAEDVLEHVADSRAGVGAIAGLLRPGGMAHVTIPNGDALPLVVADGHYLLAGLTLLEPEDAKRYFDERFDWGEYDVGDYHSYDNYTAWFEEAGLSLVDVELVDAIAWPELQSQIDAADRDVHAAAEDATLSDDVRRALIDGWRRYEARIGDARRVGPDHTMTRLGARFWRFYLTKGDLTKVMMFRPPPRWAWRSVVKRLPGVDRLVAAVRS